MKYFSLVVVINSSKKTPLMSSCGISIKRGYYIDPLTKCTSTRRLRMTKCSSICSSLPSNNRTTLLSCCKPIKPKRRYFRMICKSGFTYRQSLEFFKRCACSDSFC